MIETNKANEVVSDTNPPIESKKKITFNDSKNQSDPKATKKNDSKFESTKITPILAKKYRKGITNIRKIPTRRFAYKDNSPFKDKSPFPGSNKIDSLK